MKQQKNVPVPTSSTELAISTKALALKGEINALHRETLKSGNEMMRNAVSCGERLEELKAILKASKTTTFENWVNQNLDFTDRAARSYIKLFTDLGKLPKPERRSVLETADSIAEARRLIAATLTPDTPKPAPAPSVSATAPPPASPVATTNNDRSTTSSDSSGGGADEPTAEVYDLDEPPEEPTAEEVDYGKCPNCAGTKWTEDEDGVCCAKCRHPHGEPTGGADEDRIKTQRQKTIKTVEALQRAFDDLHLLLPRPEHPKAEEGCKVLLRMARGWK
jgi:hypothetical protein